MLLRLVVTLTMALSRPARSRGSSASVTRAGPVVLTASARSKTSNSMSCSFHISGWIPALLMSRSIGRVSRSSASRRTLAGSVTSSCRTLAPVRASSPAVSGSRAVPTTCQPAAAYWRASSRPMPRFAPVISTVAPPPPADSPEQKPAGGQARMTAARAASAMFLVTSGYSPAGRIAVYWPRTVNDAAWTRMISSRCTVVLVACLLAACGGERGDDPQARPSGATLPGVYAGTFPCGNCPGIDTTLWLRRDGRFFISQQYLQEDGSHAMTAHGLGRWQWEPDAGELVLDGKGPLRRYVRAGDDALQMVVDSALEHRLARDAAAPRTPAAMPLAGTIRLAEGGATFTECLTGYAVPVARTGEYSRFAHRYRGAGLRGRPAFVEFEGRFAWQDDGPPVGVVIDQFITVKGQGGC